MSIYGGVHRGTRSRPNANPVLAVMRDEYDGSDFWGTGMSWGFAVCDYLWHVALCDDIPEGLGYQPAATLRGEGFDEESYPEAYLVEMGLDTYTLVTAAECLKRLLDWYVAAGLDY